ncbi:hypothetical protein JTE90_010620 [Oedothorax gibbosus]|uniref:Uncharacterized protein n=1 Tax=Oedothorax gibbosus TaxID=931172 RepID=A0AAV6VGR4_9ARAC|nr:hypothetical protein JTE90_010620 [Oedothorax gibbosus]
MVGGVFPPARGTLTARRRDGWGCFSPGERNTHRAAAGWLGVFFPRREEHSPCGGGMVGGVFPPARGTLTARRRDGNPLRCDYATRWVTEVRKFPHFFSAKYTEPTELQDKRLNLLQRTDFRQF